MIDFKKKLSTNKVEIKTNPIEIYSTLDRKSIAGPLRPAQEYILNEWYESNKDKSDLIIKLHTGEGKTLVGLLILQSMINLKNGPCLYVCPNKYLVEQVCVEADKFGIPYCTFSDGTDIPDEFMAGNKLLITHAQKVFNGMSVFGTDNRYVEVGTILLDDSHACIDTIKNTFTITITKKDNEKLYNQFLHLFQDDLTEQGEGTFMDVLAGSYDSLMAVPYWSWDNKHTEVLKLLISEKDNNQIKYVWPLIKDKINDYCCFVTGSKIEISPYSANVNVFGTFSKAKHRILMSATTQDDSFFVKGLNFSPESVKNPLVDPTRKWSGEKMIIIPSLINEECDRDLMITKFSNTKIDKFGIVSIVPSTRHCYQYESLGCVSTKTDNIFDEINNLKKGQFGKLLVINNRYDGIDLPDESCRILIMDSIPFFDSLSDRYEVNACPNSHIINKRIAQKIEQGIGRGVRGEKDYCAIIIIGSDLVKFMKSITTSKFFSAQTQQQIKIGLEIADMSKEEIREEDSPATPVISLVKQMLKRDEGWKEYYVTEMNNITFSDSDDKIYDQMLEERKIEEWYSNGEYEKAIEAMQSLIDKSGFTELEKGWHLQKLARYTYFKSVSESIQLQKSAFKNNTQLFKPKEGIEYTKVSYIHQNRLNNIRKYLSQFSSYEELKMEINVILDNLSFGIEANKFELSMYKLGQLLGFVSQRPDKEIRKGPDNLWCGVNNHYLFFECKSQVEESRDEITKHEAGQMNNHCAWFDEQYGNEAKVDRFIIIPTKNLSYQADFTHDIRIIRRGKLKTLKSNIKSFIQELATLDLGGIDDLKLQSLIELHSLNSTDFKDLYSEEYYHKTR